MEQEFNLTKNQQAIFNTVESSFENFLVHGKPGVGKSVLINALVKNGRKGYTVAAPTGLAAINIGGRTLHSIFRIPVSGGIIAPDYNKFTEDTRAVGFIKYNVQYLIIDEMSMVRVDIFDYIDRLLRHVKGQPDKPFGGVQLILVGDFYQLAPVAMAEDLRQLKAAGYDSPFLFSSRVFQEHFKLLILDEVLRQKGDPEFIDLLASARDGQVLTKHTKVLNKQVGLPDDLRITLTSTNKQADEINYRELKKLPDEEVLFTAEEWGDWPAYPVEKELRLKVGARVMVKMNQADRPPDSRGGEFESIVVNGSLGIIIDIRQGTETAVDIELPNGDIATIYRKRWERKIKVKEGDEWTEKILASFEQMPLSLAWAVSMHKSQGQSFDRVHVNPSRVFAAGQMYVALSRCRSLAGLSLEVPVQQSHFWADISVIRFFEQYE